jgi:tetratricopeptide (TPR) repeat protein
MALNDLGLLYQGTGRHEDAAALFQQAADAPGALGDAPGQARALHNRAASLLALRRLPEARADAYRAAALKGPYGHAAAPWKTCGLLAEIETAAGDPIAAAAARAKARRLYAACRADGGEPMSSLDRLVAEVAALAAHPDHGPAAARAAVPGPDAFDPDLLPIRDALLACFGGDPAPARRLAADPASSYTTAAELTLLLGP